MSAVPATSETSDVSASDLEGAPSVDADTRPAQVRQRSQGELLADLADAADLRRARVRDADPGDLLDAEQRITDLETALVVELRSRRASPQHL